MTADVARVDVSFKATQVIFVYLCTVGVAIFYISPSNSLQSDWLAIFRLSLSVSQQGIPKYPSALSGDG